MRSFVPAFLFAVLCSACGRTGGLAPAEGVFVSVGDQGQAYLSDDGTAWRTAQTPVTENLIHLASGAGRFVAVGAKGTIVSSVDGERWTAHASGTTVGLSGVTWTGSRFVAVGGDWTVGAVALTSADGVAWQKLDAPANQQFHAVTARDGEVLVSAYLNSDLLTPSLYKIKEGGGWEVERNGPSFEHGLTDAAGRTLLVGSGDGARSDDGVTWTSLGISRAHSIATNGSGYLAVGDIAGVWTSGDGTSWKESRIQSGAYFLAGVAFGRGHYVAVGEPGFAIVDPEAAAANNRMADLGNGGLNDVAFGPVP